MAKISLEERKVKSYASGESTALAARLGGLWPLLWFYCTVVCRKGLELVDWLCQIVWSWGGGRSERSPSGPLLSRHSLCPYSRASTTVHHHGGDLAIDYLLFVVKVEHVDGWHLGGGTAGTCIPPGVGLVHQVGVWVLLQVHVLTLSRAIVGLVALWGNNPVPAKVLKVHCEGVAATPGLWRILITVQTWVPPGPLGALWDLHLHERLLKGHRKPWKQLVCTRAQLTAFSFLCLNPLLFGS